LSEQTAHQAFNFFNAAITSLFQMQELFNRACDEFRLVEDSDRIMVGLYGGKDSLTTVNFFALLRDASPGRFEVMSAHIKFGNLPYAADLDYLTSFCASHNVPFHLVKDKLRDAYMDGHITCVHCWHYHRAKLMDLCRVHSCNKLALGHHLDDIVATLLMSMTHHGEFAGMTIKHSLEIGPLTYSLTLIGPLCLIAENDIREFVADQGFRPEKCRCPWGDTAIQSKTRELVGFLCAGHPQARIDLFRA
jgi:tRNA(Ile)-lysidine synthase TilS/MesJ